VPAEQSVQAVEPVVLLNLPAGHANAGAMPPAQLLPAGQMNTLLTYTTPPELVLVPTK
jgi:hypothetical protein